MRPVLTELAKSYLAASIRSISEERVYQLAQRHAPSAGKPGQAIEHIRLQMHRRHDASSLAEELAALRFGEIVFVLHRIIHSHTRGFRAGSAGGQK